MSAELPPVGARVRTEYDGKRWRVEEVDDDMVCLTRVVSMMRDAVRWVTADEIEEVLPDES